MASLLQLSRKSDSGDLERGLDIVTDTKAASHDVLQDPPILSGVPRQHKRRCSLCDCGLWGPMLLLHQHKNVLLQLVVIQGVSYNTVKMLAHKHHRTIDYGFCSTGILLGGSLVLSSAATLLMRDPTHSLAEFLTRRGGRLSIARKFMQSHAADQLGDALVGLLIVTSSINTLTWYISDLPELPWNEVPGHYVWHVLSWMICIVWTAFALGVYRRSQLTWKLPKRMHPRLLTTRVFALLQHVATSRLAHLLTALAFSANCAILGLMGWDVNFAQNAGNTRNLEDKAALYGAALIICDAIHLGSELLKPCIINDWLYIFPCVTRFLTLSGLVSAVALAGCSFTSSELLTVYVATLVLHIVGLMCVSMRYMGSLSRRARLIMLEPPTSLPNFDISQAMSAKSPSAAYARPVMSPHSQISSMSGSVQPGESNPAIEAVRVSGTVGFIQQIDSSEGSSVGEAEVDSSPGNSDKLTAECSDSMRPLRILCLDGGGAKGMNTILMLKAIETGCGKPINELFDLICGTSIGSCIGAFAALGASTDTLMEMIEGICYKGCDSCGALMTTSSTWRLLTKGFKMTEDGMSRYVEHLVKTRGYGVDQAMAAPTASIPHFFSVTTEEQPDDKWLPFVVSNYARDGPGFASKGSKGAPGGWSFHRQLVASCSAPTYWPSVVDPKTGTQYVDGGIVANNPSMLALQEARAIWPGRPVGCVVSLGCGMSVATEQTKAGLVYWAGKMLSLPTDSYRAHKDFEAIVPFINGPGAEQPSYFRLEPVIPNVQLDECKKYVLDEMRRITKSYIVGDSQRIDHLCSVLTSLS